MIWDKNGLWLRTPVSHPTTDREVSVLAKELDERLSWFLAKEYGIC